MLSCQHWRLVSPYVRSMMSRSLAIPSQWREVQHSNCQEYNEIAVGGCCRNEKLQQYLENDRRVLRFQTFWDENGKYGSRKFPGQTFALLFLAGFANIPCVGSQSSRNHFSCNRGCDLSGNCNDQKDTPCPLSGFHQARNEAAKVLHFALLFG